MENPVPNEMDENMVRFLVQLNKMNGPKGTPAPPKIVGKSIDISETESEDIAKKLVQNGYAEYSAIGGLTITQAGIDFLNEGK